MNRRMTHGFYLIILGSAIAMGMQQELENSLVSAVRYSEEDTVRLLLQQKADPNITINNPSLDGYSYPLLYTAQTTEIAQLLLDHKAKLIDKVADHNTLLKNVVMFYNNAALIPLYAKYGTDPDVICNSEYGTALHMLHYSYTSQENQKRLLVAGELIKAGASLNILITGGWAKGLTCVQKWHVALNDATLNDSKKYYQDLLETIKRAALERKKSILDIVATLIPITPLQALILDYYEREKFDMAQPEIADCLKIARKNEILLDIQSSSNYRGGSSGGFPGS